MASITPCAFAALFSGEALYEEAVLLFTSLFTILFTVLLICNCLVPDSLPAYTESVSAMAAAEIKVNLFFMRVSF